MLVDDVRSRLKELADPELREKIVRWERQYCKEPKLHGLSTPAVRKVSSQFYLCIKNRSKQEIFALCKELLKSQYTEERTIAFDWAYRTRRHYEKSDFEVFESWLKQYVRNWGSCDDLCTHVFGVFIFKFPEFIPNVRNSTSSADWWVRRASAVVMIYSIRRGKGLQDIFKIADALLTDDDIMVQKGYGWMLKEASKTYPKEVFDYVIQHKEQMPRVSLRYAIEKLSPTMRKEAMRK